MPEAAFVELFQAHGLAVTVLERLRNARTNHPATQVIVYRATKR